MTTPEFNWAQYLLGQPVKCTFTPRESYKGVSLQDNLWQHIGKQVTLTALWQMGDEDPYPGEWALSAAPLGGLIFGRTWIASGDVTVLPTEADHG